MVSNGLLCLSPFVDVLIFDSLQICIVLVEWKIHVWIVKKKKKKPY